MSGGEKVKEIYRKGYILEREMGEGERKWDIKCLGETNMCI